MPARQQTSTVASRLNYIRMDRSVRDALNMLQNPGVDALVVIDGVPLADGAIVGIITEREIFRAMASRGLEVLDNLVWMLAKQDFASADVSTSNADRLKLFCAYQTDHIAVTDGFVLTSIQSIWSCVDAMTDRSTSAHS
ncbi:CBS domain-containing protein [Methylobacterium sp. CM6247]